MDLIDRAVKDGWSHRGACQVLEWEQTEIVALFNEGARSTAPTASSHRGSYLGRVRVSPSSVHRVLAAHGLTLRRPFPARVSYDKNSIWIYDTTISPAALTSAPRR